MDLILNNQASIWLLLGFLLLAIEAVAFGFTSGLLLFCSLASILTGLVLWFEWLPNQFPYAIGFFAISSALVALVLWKPLQALQSGSELGQDRSSDLIGHRFILKSSIERGSPGKQKYSGIEWQVQPSLELKDTHIESGTLVKVCAVKVGVFYVESAEP